MGISILDEYKADGIGSLSYGDNSETLLHAFHT